MVFIGFNKKEKGFDDSQRNIVGVAWDYKKITLYTEYMMSKNVRLLVEQPAHLQLVMVASGKTYSI